MAMLEDDVGNAAGCPVTNYTDINTPIAPAGWHFDNFDVKREEAPVHIGDAGGYPFYLVTRMDDIRRSFQTADTFSNSSVIPAEPNPSYLWIPEMLDGQVHTAWRKLLGSWFAPGAVAALEPMVRGRFAELLDSVADRGECDFVRDVAVLYPNVIFMEIMGIPKDDADQFLQWEDAILHGGRVTDADRARRQQAMSAVTGYFGELITDRRRNPRDDLLSTALGWEIDGEPVADEDLQAFYLFMFMAGLDTVAVQLSYSFWHLATHDADRRRLVAEPELVPLATEELLRYYAFVTPGRKVVKDTEIAGCPVPAGSMVYLPLPPANRDPREFPDADQVILDRPDNRHLAFGAGPHRCLGSHLARQELRVALQMWHERIPEYRLAEGAVVREHGGQIGMENLPLVWDT